MFSYICAGNSSNITIKHYFMDSKVTSKVFVLAYNSSEEDHGPICVFPSYELAKEAKLYAEAEAKSSPFYFRFWIDVYEVNSVIPRNEIKYFCHPGFKIDNLVKD